MGNDLPQSRVAVLMGALGIDPESFEEFWEWALSEHLVMDLSRSTEIDQVFFSRKTALADFINVLNSRTNRVWSEEDARLLFDRVKTERETHYRRALPYQERLRFLTNTPRECSKCRRRPPEVKLHIDHIRPVAKGGGNEAKNLQFLCQEHNLKKSNSMEVRRWLNLT